MLRRPTRSPLCPYTTLFRSNGADQTTLYQTLLQSATGKPWYKVFVISAGTTSGNGNLILSKYPFIATASNLMPASRSAVDATRSEEHTSELQSLTNLVCRLL